MSDPIPTTPEEIAELAIAKMMEQKAQTPGCKDVVMLARRGPELLDLVSVHDAENFRRLVEWFSEGSKDLVGCFMIIGSPAGVALHALMFRPCFDDPAFAKALCAKMEEYVGWSEHKPAGQILGTYISEVPADI